MTINSSLPIQEILQQLHRNFVEELPERLNAIEDLLIALEEQMASPDGMTELFRAVHSLKGSGGTFGLHAITTICHQLEDFLKTLSSSQTVFGKKQADACFHFVDLLREVTEQARQGKEDFSHVEKNLFKLHQEIYGKAVSALLVSNSKLITQIAGQLLSQHKFQVTVLDDPMIALLMALTNPYDLLIVPSELAPLSGQGLIAALRLSSSCNRGINTILITSVNSSAQLSKQRATDTTYIVLRDNRMADNLNTLLGDIANRLGVVDTDGGR